MAESSGEKTEMPTPKKLRDARQKGQVCQSKDIVSTALLVVLFAVLAWMGSALLLETQQLVATVGGRLADPAGGAVQACGALTILLIFKYSFIFVVVAAVVGIVANIVQVGFLFTFEPLKPNFSKLNPAEGAKKIFSKKNFFEFLKNCVKVVFLSYLLYKIIWASVPELLQMCYGTIDDIMPSLRVMLKRLAVYTAAGYILIAVVDRIFQGKNFTKEMMMTKDEVKREYKEMEGTPSRRPRRRTSSSPTRRTSRSASATTRRSGRCRASSSRARTRSRASSARPRWPRASPSWRTSLSPARSTPRAGSAISSPNRSSSPSPRSCSG